MNVRIPVWIIIATAIVSTAGIAAGSDLSKLKGASVSPNGNYALWCRITKTEWIKNSWKIPLYPFIIAISGHKVPLRWGFNSKCTVVDKNRKDLFDWPYGGWPGIWSPDGNILSQSGGTAKAYILTENKSVDIPPHSRSVWIENNLLLLVTKSSSTAVISTFDVLTEQSVELDRLQLPDWVVVIPEITLCNNRLKFLAKETYPPKGLDASIVFVWDVGRRALIERRDYKKEGVDDLMDMRTCAK